MSLTHDSRTKSWRSVEPFSPTFNQMDSSSSRKKRKPKPSSSPSPNLFPLEPPVNSLPSSKSDLFRLIAVVSIAAAVAATCNFIANSLEPPPLKPFCDTLTSDYNDFLPGFCEPCPANGVCYDGKLGCGEGYRRQGSLCVEDGDVIEAAKKLTKWVEVRVCEAYAQLSCGGSGKSWFSVDELWNNVTDKYGMDGAVFMPAKQRAMETIQNLLETRRDNHGVEELKCPELLVDHYKPLSCCVRQWIIKHALILAPACALFIACVSVAYRAYRKHRMTVRIELLYHEVCDILEEKPLLCRSINVEGEPWVVASWLRDHLLTPKERRDQNLWRQVEELVREDSRIEQYPKLVNGESKVVWEWQVEGPLSSSGKRKSSDGHATKLKKIMTSSPNVQRQMHAGHFDDLKLIVLSSKPRVS